MKKPKPLIKWKRRAKMRLLEGEVKAKEKSDARVNDASRKSIIRMNVPPIAWASPTKGSVMPAEVAKKQSELKKAAEKTASF